MSDVTPPTPHTVKFVTTEYMGATGNIESGPGEGRRTDTALDRIPYGIYSCGELLSWYGLFFLVAVIAMGIKGVFPLIAGSS